MGPALRSFEDHLSDVYFADLPLPHAVRAGIAACGFVQATPVQAATLPLLLAGKDVAAQAQTGTGKTAAFLVSIFTRLAAAPRTSRTGDPPRALVVAPTRELAVQIRDDAVALGHFVKPRIVTVFGGIDYGRQRDALRAGCDVLIGTPGRLLDYEQQGATSFRSVEELVIDEADRLFDMGFIVDLRRCPPPHRRHSMLFSATLSVRVMELAWEHMNNAEKIEIRPEQVTADRVTQVLYHVGSREKIPLLTGLLKREMTLGEARVMLFVNTKRFAERLVTSLERHGFRIAALTGDLPQARRLRILADFKGGRLPLLVATDVASRGLHIEGVTHVINVDLPQDPEDYVHRIGRTARAGRAGQAISLADENYVFSLDAIERLIAMKIPSEFPDPGLFVWEAPRPPRVVAGGGQSGSPRHLPPDEDVEPAPAPRPRLAPGGPRRVPAPPAPEEAAPPGEDAGAGAVAEARGKLPAPAEEPVPGSAAVPAPDSDFWTREAFGLDAPEEGFLEVAAFLPGAGKRRRRRRKARQAAETT
jgi:ATP-dependent RNA helicase RhlB